MLFSGGSRISQMGEPTPEFGPKTYYLRGFLPKTAWKWKKLDRGGHIPGAPPPWSANAIKSNFCETKITKTVSYIICRRLDQHCISLPLCVLPRSFKRSVNIHDRTAIQIRKKTLPNIGNFFSWLWTTKPLLSPFKTWTIYHVSTNIT